MSLRQISGFYGQVPIDIRFFEHQLACHTARLAARDAGVLHTSKYPHQHVKKMNADVGGHAA